MKLNDDDDDEITCFSLLERGFYCPGNEIDKKRIKTSSSKSFATLFEY